VNGLASIPTLTTARLRLRGWHADDWKPYAAFCADLEVMRHIGAGGAATPEETWRSMAVMLGHWALRGHGMWALERKADGVLIGRAGFIDPPGWPGFELGWLLGREHWGQGYAREAAQAALGYCADVLGRREVISLIRPANTRSIALALRLGATLREGIDFLGSEALVYTIAR
jgi:RimJ/RimL family protein N-acetyltransferase